MSDAVRLIDTSTLSEVIKGHDAHVQEKGRVYLETHGRFTFSVLTRFEILRGLLAKSASRQVRQFERFCSRSEVLPLTDEAVVKGAKIYALLRHRGALIDDIDILIAATALVSQLDLATENIAHFNRVPNLQVESWRSS